MPACTIVRIASGTKASETFWTVQPGGALILDSESQAQFFVCHSEVADRSCLIQHLQSGAFVEQGDDRKLKLTLSSASAAVFSKLRAYSQDVKKEVVTDAVWLRAATGGIVCSGTQGDLAVAVNATNDAHAGQCSFRFLEADPNSLLMKGLASHTATSCQAHQPDALDISLRLHYPPAPVSIGAKPLSPHFTNRSSAMPIALRRPIRKVSFSDLTTLDQSAGSDGKPAPLQTSLPRNSDSFSRSYTLKDAFSNRIPTSPGYSLHSEGSETDESKVRGGHLFDSEDRASSRDSLSQLDEALSGAGDSSTASPPQTSAGGQHEQQSVPSTSPEQQQQQSLGNQTQKRAARCSSDENDDKLSRGTTTRGGNLYHLTDANKSSMRSIRSTSALGLIPTNVSHSATHRAIKGHRTHGSSTALSFLSGGYAPSSPHRIPRAAEQPLDLVQSAPVVGAGLLAGDGSHSSHGNGHSQHGSHVLLGSMNSSQKAWGRGRGCCDNSEALAGLRLSRVSGDGHREPMLPCILEGLPSRDSDVSTACPPALDELLGRSSQTCKLQHMRNGMKRACSSPEMHGSLSSLHHPIIHKVTPRGSPSNPSPLKRLHTHSSSLDRFPSGAALPTFGKSAVL